MYKQDLKNARTFWFQSIYQKLKKKHDSITGRFRYTF